MSPIASRRWALTGGLLLCVGSGVFTAVAAVIYAMRWTYVRPVYLAVQQGRDPYQAARDGVASIAADFMVLVVVSAVLACTVGIAISLGILISCSIILLRLNKRKRTP